MVILLNPIIKTIYRKAELLPLMILRLKPGWGKKENTLFKKQ